MNIKIDLESLQTKAKERTVKTQTIEYDLETLVKKVQKNVIKLDPDYQRRHRWDNETSSRLIESLILNIPIPIVYLSYDIDVDTNEEGARFSVIDGQQRLTAIVNFFEDKFALEELDILTDLDGFKYSDLPPFLLRRLEERTIKCLRIDSTVDPQVKFDIFERLNSGSVKLESHELRNAVLRGPFNDMCKKLSGDVDFRKLVQIGSEEPSKNAKVQKMEDVELVLRFFALIEDRYKTYKKTKENQFKDFLSDYLVDANKLSADQIEKKARLFRETMKFIITHFGEAAFAKYKYVNKQMKKQSSFNAAVYDALTVAIASDVNLRNPKNIKKKAADFLSLFKNPDFHEKLSGSILDTTKLIGRIDSARKAFK